MRNCPKCKCGYNEISKWGVKMFCSRKCANSRIMSAEVKDKISKSVIQSISKNPQVKGISKSLIDKTCPICSTTFRVFNSTKRVYCSRSCYDKDVDFKFRLKPIGGYRERSGRSKSGYYKGIYCGSTYELCWVIFALDSDINFKRFDGFLTDGKTKYFPDFELIGKKHIIEIKGFEYTKSVEIKTRLAEKCGYIVDVLRKENLKPVFEYVEKKFGTKKFYTLYDTFDPKYKYSCSHCGGVFERKELLKTTTKFCSRGCCGKGLKLYKTNVGSIPIRTTV